MITFSNGGGVSGAHSTEGTESRENSPGLISKYTFSPTPPNSASHPQLMQNTFHLFKGTGNKNKKKA